MNIYGIIIFIIIFLSFINLILCFVFPRSTCYSSSKEPHNISIQLSRINQQPNIEEQPDRECV